MSDIQQQEYAATYEINSHDGGKSSDTGILLAIYYAGFGGASPIFNLINDHVLRNRKGVMLMGVCIEIISLFLFLFVTEFWMLALGRLCHGLGSGCITTLGYVVVADHFPSEVLGKQMGKAYMFYKGGVAVGGPIGGLELLLILLIVERRSSPNDWFVDSSEKEMINTSATTVPIDEACSQIDDDKEVTITTMRLLRSPQIWTIILVSFCSGWAVVVFEVLLPIYLNEEWGYNTSEIGLLLVIILIPTVVGSIISGYVYDRIGAKILSFSALILGGACLAVSGISNRATPGGVVPLITTTAANEFFASVYKGATLPETSRVAKSLANGSDCASSYAYGLSNIAFASGCLTSPLFGGYLFECTNFTIMCITASSVLFVVAPFALVFLGNHVTGFSYLKRRLFQ
ncbi:major facilitator superfamily domain-containing protein [Zychaea mexicana]|uniref:major facilitator superfamily domain-containing protein n=1 Tax=Zychaea mexicana TaxID=64656 RepID=UPI0022FE1A1D|nr:major facilitator superfamily domain-containing protein [Zychaea mexicana]KAI9469352.1 major facilitator superfamily domain-containing protein [Zychaea mexicana]